MAFRVGTGVISQAFGTGTVVASGNDRATVRFDKDDAERTLLNEYLQPSHHEIKIPVKLMETMELTLADLRQLERMTIKPRADCWASFSANAMNDIWMFVTRGWTKEEKRKYVQGECWVIERIAEVYLSKRLSGGRVLLRSDGAFYRTNAPKATRHQREDVLIAQFKLPENWMTEGPVSFRPPQRAIYVPCEVEPPPLPRHDPSPASD